jgi:iron complex transport system ATP-binding protein
MSAPLLEARQLSVEIGGKTVVDRMNLSLVPGERLAILGRNGAGKSTLLSTLAGLRPPQAGAVLLDGEDCALLPARQAALRRAWLG